MQPVVKLFLLLQHYQVAAPEFGIPGGIMFQVTEKANEMIREFQKHQEEIPPIRLRLFSSSCGKPTLRMTLDEPQENDETFHDRGLTFLIDKQLFEQVKPVKIDYVHTASGDGDGFSISANLSKVVSSGSRSCA
jgi:Fe-S cluster assembly iron-binding protein IscA